MCSLTGRYGSQLSRAVDKAVRIIYLARRRHARFVSSSPKTHQPSSECRYHIHTAIQTAQIRKVERRIQIRHKRRIGRGGFLQRKRRQQRALSVFLEKRGPGCKSRHVHITSPFRLSTYHAMLTVTLRSIGGSPRQCYGGSVSMKVPS